MDEFRSKRHMTVTNESVIEIGDANDESEKSLLWAKKLKEQIFTIMDMFGTEYTTKLSVFTKLGLSTSFCAHRMQSSVAASWKKANDGNPVVKPTWVLAYNRFMGLMDHQLISSTQQVYLTVTKVGQALAVKDIQRRLDD